MNINGYVYSGFNCDPTSSGSLIGFNENYLSQTEYTPQVIINSNIGSILQSNYNAPYIIHDGTKFIACGYCIAAGPAICYSTDGITWTTCTGCSNLNLNYIAYNDLFI